MAFDGSGVFKRLYNWVQDRNNGIKILAQRMDDEMDGFATGLSTCITKDGQTTVTADIPFSNNKIRLLAAGVLTTDAANVGQLQSGTANYAGTAAGSGTYTAALPVTPSAYVDGFSVKVYFADTNATSATATLNINSLGARNLVDAQGSILRRNAVIPGIAQVISVGSQLFYSPPPANAPYGLYDAGSITNSSTAQLFRFFSIDCTATSGTIATDQSATAGDFFAFVKTGNQNLTIALGTQLMNGSSAVPVTAGEGMALMRYTGATRGWVEG
jgi:hypothetical protein